VLAMRSMCMRTMAQAGQWSLATWRCIWTMHLQVVDSQRNQMFWGDSKGVSVTESPYLMCCLTIIFFVTGKHWWPVWLGHSSAYQEYWDLVKIDWLFWNILKCRYDAIFWFFEWGMLSIINFKVNSTYLMYLSPVFI